MNENKTNINWLIKVIVTHRKKAIIDEKKRDKNWYI